MLTWWNPAHRYMGRFSDICSRDLYAYGYLYKLFINRPVYSEYLTVRAVGTLNA